MIKRSGIRRGKSIVKDEWLWGKVADQVEPLRQGKRREKTENDSSNKTADSNNDRQPRPFRPEPAPARNAGEHPRTNIPKSRQSEPAPRKGPPPLAELDRKRTRKLATGRMDIEARIDLHGMRQGEAHAALRSFLRQAQTRGLRTVLVITGKGGVRRERNDRDFMFASDELGVLKRAVPHWLAEPDLRGIVVGFGEASARHGGGGATYVQLRRARG